MNTSTQQLASERHRPAHAVRSLWSASQRRERDCPACSSRNLDIPFRRRLPWLVACSACGLQFVNPQPTHDELAAIYDGDYFRRFGWTKAAACSYRALLRARADWLLDLADSQIARGRLLDVGSGVGELLIVAQQRGWEVVGVEPNSAAVEQAGCEVVELTRPMVIEELPEREAGFDLVVCADVLEHLRDPANVLRGLCSRLRPGGLLLLTTVNVQSWAARVLRSGWFHYHRDHLWYFTRTSLLLLARQAGLEPLSCGVPWKPFQADYLQEVLQRTTRGRFVSAIARIVASTLRVACRRRMIRLPEGLCLVAQRPVVTHAGETRKEASK